LKRIRVSAAIAVLFLAVLFLFSGAASHALAVSVPTISNATVVNQKTSLTLPSGGQIYIYAYTTGGEKSSTGFAFSGPPISPPNSVKNADGNVVAAFAATTSNTNSFGASSPSFSIGGASVSGFSTIKAKGGSAVSPIVYGGIDGAPGANGASMLVYVPRAGSLVVVIAIAGDEQCITSVLGLPGFVIDASNSNSAGLPNAITIGHAYSNPTSSASYQVTEVTSQCAAGQDPNHAADLIGIYVFAP